MISSLKKTLSLVILVVAITFNATGNTKVTLAFSEYSLPNPQMNTEIPNIFSSVSNLFRRLFRKKSKPISCIFGPEIVSLSLSETRVSKGCKESAATENHLKIKVSSEITENSPREMFFYHYEVSGGKIIGEGKDVVWDLSDVDSGTYTITGSIDNGCIECGRHITKSVIVEKCND